MFVDNRNFVPAQIQNAPSFSPVQQQQGSAPVQGTPMDPAQNQFIALIFALKEAMETMSGGWQGFSNGQLEAAGGADSSAQAQAQQAGGGAFPADGVQSFAGGAVAGGTGAGDSTAQAQAQQAGGGGFAADGASDGAQSFVGGGIVNADGTPANGAGGAFGGTGAGDDDAAKNQLAAAADGTSRGGGD